MDIRFQPLSRTTMSRDIVQTIIEMINTGKLKPGAKLPSEREMMEQLQVSRSPVREALTSLSLVGLLETIPGDGTYVSRNLMGELIFDQLEWSSLLTTPKILEMIEIREPLEIQAAGLAALRATQETMDPLRKAVKMYIESGEDPILALQADHAFHQSIANLSGNQLIIQLLGILWGVWRKFHSEGQLHFSVSRVLQDDYLDVLTAIETGNTEQARQAMARHLEHSRDISYAFETTTGKQAGEG